MSELAAFAVGYCIVWRKLGEGIEPRLIEWAIAETAERNEEAFTAGAKAALEDWRERLQMRLAGI